MTKPDASGKESLGWWMFMVDRELRAQHVDIYVMVECVCQCGLHFYRHSIQEEECLKHPDIQLKSGLHKIEENEHLKQEVSVLKEKLNVVMEVKGTSCQA